MAPLLPSYHIMALFIIFLWLCLCCTSAQLSSWGGLQAGSPAWTLPPASRPNQTTLEGVGVENTTALTHAIARKDDRVITDHTGSYFMPIPPFFLLYIRIYIIYIYGGVSFVSVTAVYINGPGPARSSKIMWVEVISWRHLVHLVLDGSSM